MPLRAPTLNSLFPKPRPKENRQSAAKRGYDRRWQRLRSMVMREEPALLLLSAIWPNCGYYLNRPQDTEGKRRNGCAEQSYGFMQEL
jgi:hypothetical protein